MLKTTLHQVGIHVAIQPSGSRLIALAVSHPEKPPEPPEPPKASTDAGLKAGGIPGRFSETARTATKPPDLKPNAGNDPGGLGDYGSISGNPSGDGTDDKAEVF